MPGLPHLLAEHAPTWAQLLDRVAEPLPTFESQGVQQFQVLDAKHAVLLGGGGVRDHVQQPTDGRLRFAVLVLEILAIGDDPQSCCVPACRCGLMRPSYMTGKRPNASRSNCPDLRRRCVRLAQQPQSARTTTASGTAQAASDAVAAAGPWHRAVSQLRRPRPARLVAAGRRLG